MDLELVPRPEVRASESTAAAESPPTTKQFPTRVHRPPDRYGFVGMVITTIVTELLSFIIVVPIHMHSK